MKKATLRSLDSRALDKRRLSRGSDSSQQLSKENSGKATNALDSKCSTATGFLCIAPDVKVGKNVRFSQFINLYGCEVGDETKIGAFVEIQKNAKIGRRCKISSHTFICEGVTIEDEVFVGHNVTFVNDSFPRATSKNGILQTEADWKVEPTLIKKGASIGSGATILANVRVGENSLIGAGAVVTKDVPANVIVIGNPAKIVRYLKSGTKNE
jgi:UDP-2-acetamido-3-amino-2,3-dideoxy-glucuronate N-acetyltransferase